MPIDLEYPEDRVQYMLSDSGAKLLLTEEKVAELLEDAHDQASNKTYNDEAALGYGIQLAYYAAQKYYTTIQELDTGKGYGSELMAAAIGIAQKAGCRVLLSNITKGNRASERLHEKFGFEEKGTFEDVGYKFGKWLSITYYSKKLNPTDSEPEPLVNPAEQKTEE